MKSSSALFIKSALVPVLAVALFSCTLEKKESPNIIDFEEGLLNSKVVNLSDIAGKIEYIPLETTDSSLVGRIIKIIYEQDLFYVVSGSTIKIFDKSGKYLRTFNRKGRGPQEYTNLGMAEVEHTTGNIIVGTHTGILEYDKMGTFVRKINFPQLDSLSPSLHYKLGENLFISSLSSNNVSHYKEISAVTYDTLSTIMARVPAGKEDYYAGNTMADGIKFYGKSNATLSQFKDNIRIWGLYGEVVLSVNAGNKIDTAYILKYGKYKSSAGKLGEETQTSEFIRFIGYPLESTNCLFLSVLLHSLRINEEDANTSKALYNKGSGELIYLKNSEKNCSGICENLMNGPAFWPKYISSDDHLVTTIDALTLIEYAETHKVSTELARLAGKLKETDNPIVIIAK